MDPDAALDLATDPYAEPVDRANACAQLVAWIRGGGFLPDFTRFGYRVTHPVYVVGHPPYLDDWIVEDDFDQGHWTAASGVFDTRYRAVNDCVHRIFMDRDARMQWLAVNGI